MVEKIKVITDQRDSITALLNETKNELKLVKLSNDSLVTKNQELSSENDFLNKHTKEIQKEIEKINNNKTPSTPSMEPIPVAPTIPISPSSAPSGKIELGQPSSPKTQQAVNDNYESSLDTDTEIGFDDEEDFKITEEKKDTTVQLLPLSKQKIKLRKAVKTP